MKIFIKNIVLPIFLLLFSSCHKTKNSIEKIDIYSKEVVSKIKSSEYKTLEINEKTCGGNTIVFSEKNKLIAFYNINGGEYFETLDMFFVKDNKIVKIERSIISDKNNKYRILYYTPTEKIKINSLPENHFGYSDKQIFDCGNQILKRFKNY
ncbi:hypothetical protein [Kaistella sp.]|uniref:hypothetical protein n=1 Tax=Kaistella sp. TaxID=2782235 RepID=UPI003C6AECB4